MCLQDAATEQPWHMDQVMTDKYRTPNLSKIHDLVQDTEMPSSTGIIQVETMFEAAVQANKGEDECSRVRHTG